MNVAAKKLSAYLEREQISQATLAAQIGVAKSTVTRLLNNKRLPSRVLANRISRVTNGAIAVDDWPDSVNDACEAVEARC